jgi:plasmid stabilization system protein ParE
VNYTVAWTNRAEADLIHLWVHAADRPVVTLAADKIDSVLCTNPYAFSKGLAANRRVMTIRPLAVGYTVSDPDSRVTVWAVWRVDDSNGSVV